MWRGVSRRPGGGPSGRPGQPLTRQAALRDVLIVPAHPPRTNTACGFRSAPPLPPASRVVESLHLDFPSLTTGVNPCSVLSP